MTMAPTTSSTFRRSCAEAAATVSQGHHYIREDGTVIEVCTTDRRDGDFHLHAELDGLVARRSVVMPGAWAVAQQVHGAAVVDGDPRATPQADALITTEVGQPIAVQGADCAPIAFITDGGPVAVAHAGWRGLAAGVIDETIGRLEEQGARTQCAVVGPTIGPECYEFGRDDLDHVASLLGEEVRGSTSAGAPALDLRSAITSAFAKHDVIDVRFVGGCTACENAVFSHRARGDVERHALAARILPEAER